MMNEQKNKEKDLTVILMAKELASYTIKETGKENNFPRRYRFTITNKIVDKAIEIYTLLYEANELYPHNAEELEKRQNKQRMAMAYCRSMDATIEIAKNAFKIPQKTTETWTSKIFNVRTLTAAWFKKDAERFKGKF